MSHQLGHVARVQPFNVQGMKTSVLYDDEEDYMPSPKTAVKNQQLFSNKSIFSSTYVDSARKQSSAFPKLDTSRQTNNNNEQSKLNSSLFQPMVNSENNAFERATKMAKTSHLFKSGLLKPSQGNGQCFFKLISLIILVALALFVLSVKPRSTKE